MHFTQTSVHSYPIGMFYRQGVQQYFFGFSGCCSVGHIYLSKVVAGCNLSFWHISRMATHLHATHVWGYGDYKIYSLEFKVSNDVGIIDGASET